MSYYSFSIQLNLDGYTDVLYRKIVRYYQAKMAEMYEHRILIDTELDQLRLVATDFKKMEERN